MTKDKTNNSEISTNNVSQLQEIWDYIENKEYNYLDGGLLSFAKDIQLKIEQKIFELNK